MRVKNLNLKKEALGNLLKTTTEQDIKTTIETKLNNIKKELGKGREFKAGKFTYLYQNAEGLYRREELRRGGGRENSRSY